MGYRPAPEGWWQKFVAADPPRTAKVGVVRADGSPHVVPVGARYVHADRAEEHAGRNGVPGEVVVRVRPEKVVAMVDLAE